MSNDLMQIHVQLRDGSTYDVDLNKTLRIGLGKLDAELVNQPAKFVWIAALCEKAKTDREEAELDTQETYAQLDTHYRTVGIARGVKGTETAIEQAIKGNTHYKESVRKVIHASEQHRLLAQAREALLQRKDMLIQVSANQREERKQV